MYLYRFMDIPLGLLFYPFDFIRLNHPANIRSLNEIYQIDFWIEVNDVDLNFHVFLAHGIHLGIFLIRYHRRCLPLLLYF